MTPDQSTIAVACAADARYALPLAVMLHSVACNAAPGVAVRAYVLDDGVSAEDRRKVEGSIPGNIHVEWRRAVSPLNGFPTWGRMPVTTYQKLTLDEWLPQELERVIWLDCDLLVLADISRLWRSEDRSIVLAVQDPRVHTVSARFGVAAWRELAMPADWKYFNAGVLVIDLAQWRRQEVRRLSIEYIRAYRDRVYFWDQEGLNAVLAGKWGELDARWNSHPSLDHLPRNGNHRILKNPRTTDAPAAAQSIAIQSKNGHLDSQPSSDNWILHFSGNLKPWDFAGDGQWHRLYRSYLERTAWAGWVPERRWQNGLVSWYETSRLRRLLYPTEQLATMIQQKLTRRQSKIHPDGGECA